MIDYPPPNKLVTTLAQELVSKDELVVMKATAAYVKAKEERDKAKKTERDEAEKERDEAAKALYAAYKERDEPKKPFDQVAKALAWADALAADPTIPPLVTFAGFLGGTVVCDETRWRVFYLDPKLLTWLLVREDDILDRQTLKDVTAPFGERDLIWLRSSASVTEGRGPPRADELEAQFVRGDFIGAGDFSASLTGGTFSRATGLLCEVQTPGCCGKYTR